MGNQQERSLPLAWFGGLATGEGSFGFTVHKLRHDRTKITPLFSLGMKDEASVDLAQQVLIAHGLPVYRAARRANAMHYINVSGYKRLKKYCEALIPYLGGQKREAAETVLAFVNSRLSKPRYEPYTREEVELVLKSRRINGNRSSARNDPMDALKNAVHGEHHRQKTHCPQGHEYTPENVVITNTGARRCRKCATVATLKWRAKSSETNTPGPSH